MKMVLAAEEIGTLEHTSTAGYSTVGLDPDKKEDQAAYKANEQGEKTANDSNAEMAARMAQLTAEMQAHGQMYKLVQEATTTAIKTVGEALHSTARKQ